MDQNRQNFVVSLDGTPDKEHKSPSGLWKIVTAIAIAVTLSVAALAFSHIAPPEGNLSETTIEIPLGHTVLDIGFLLEKEGIVRSGRTFALMTQLMGYDRNIPAGTYIFEGPEDLLTIVKRLGSGDHGVEKVRVTFPEGSSVSEIAELAARQLPNFDSEEFIRSYSADEGYLFPDTYFFFSTATTGPVGDALKANFEAKTKNEFSAALSANKIWHDIIVMASIIEEETVTPEDRRLVSGILWNRISKGMRLQVDAPFMYLLGKGTSEITIEDLNMDSPYNTYRNEGLPPGAISSPGLDSIKAALEPTKTNDLYYLSDKNGTMHYARTFEEHKLNKEKYLR
jgi:UPF0755 protein